MREKKGEISLKGPIACTLARTTLENKYGEDFVYDKNGYITSLGRRNSSANTSTITYTYSGNKRNAWSYDANGNILEQFDYLPYGGRCIKSNLAVVNTGKTDYLYTGKELPQLFGIDWYDSVARWQTTSGVFSSPDPLMEKYYSVSPYVYCAGNPVTFVDPKGLSPIYDIDGAFLGTDDEGLEGEYIVMERK